MNNLQQQRQNDVILLSGDLNIDNVLVLAGDNRPRFEGQLMQVDLANVSHVDSAGLALLVDWMRAADEAGCQLSFLHVPEKMRSLARVTGMDGVLNFQ